MRNISDGLLVLPVVGPCIPPIDPIRDGTRRCCPSQACIISRRITRDKSSATFAGDDGSRRSQTKRCDCGSINAGVLPEVSEVDTVDGVAGSMLLGEVFSGLTKHDGGVTGSRK